MIKNKEAPKPLAGDYIEVSFGKTIYEGTLLEPPEDRKDILLLKLGNGYNIGLNKKEILGIKILKMAETSPKKELEIKKNPSKPNIGVIFTGGTIASKLDPKTGAVKWLESPEELFKFYPKILEIVNIYRIEVPFLKGSENIDCRDWQKIAKISADMLNDKDIKGVIITHGTDSLNYTSAAISFFLRNLNKPVVLTYAQRSTDRASSDAALNLECSAMAATSEIAEVMIVGHESSEDNFCIAIPGTKAKKLHSSRRDAFKTINSLPFARISKKEIKILRKHNYRNKNKVLADTKFEEKVALIKFYPGQDSSILDYYIKNGYKGIVIESLGLGQIATSEARLSWTKKLKEVIKKGLTVCFTAQTIYGRLDPLVYSTGRELVKTGVIFLEDMLSETAFVKLGWVLGHKEWLSPEKIKEKMLENIADEINHKQDYSE